jgi:hypothetical protein
VSGTPGSIKAKSEKKCPLSIIQGCRSLIVASTQPRGSGVQYLGFCCRFSVTSNPVPNLIRSATQWFEVLFGSLKTHPEPANWKSRKGIAPRLAQTVKALIAVRCKSLDRQDHCTAF